MPSLHSVFRRHIGTLFAITLLLAATSSSAGPVESAQPTLDDALIYEIVTHARPVLLFTQLTNNHILVIIGSTKHRGVFTLADFHVFEQPLESLGHDSIYLKPSTPFLTRWPAVTGEYRAMFALPDSTGDNIILDAREYRNGYVLQLSTGTLEALPKIDGNPAISILRSTWTLSSTELVHYFWMDNTYPSMLVEQHFNSDTLDQATDVLQDKKNYFICDSGLSSRGQRIYVSSVHCQVPIKWNLTAGFTNATSFVLVDKTNAVLIFDRSVLTSGKPTDVVKIPAEKFWVKWVPPLEPSNQTRASSTEKPAGTESTKPTTVSLPSAAKFPVLLVLAIAVPNLLLVICLVGLGIYCLCKPSDKSDLAKPPKAVGGSRSKQDHKSAARTTRKGTKKKHGSSHNAANLKTKAARSSTVAKKTTASSSSHLPGTSAIASKAASKVGKTSKSSAVGKSATSVSKAPKNANASTSKRSLAGPTATSSKAARVH